MAADPGPAPSRGLVAGATLLLFLVWSNSFVAMSYLLGRETEAPRLDWLTLTTGRFAPVTVLAGIYCFGLRRAESLALLRAHGPRLAACGLLGGPLYGFALYWAMQQGVPAPVASLITALSPLFMLALGAAFLRERVTARKVAGFGVCLAGLVLLSRSRGGVAGAAALPVAVACLAPLCWSCLSALSKPVAREVPPFLWTMLYLVAGGIPLLAALPWAGGRELLSLDPPGWAALLYLSLACTVFGFAAWAWLVKRLPVSTAGLTTFLNPPLTLVSKAALAALFPATFTFGVAGGELAGGVVVLAGLAVALLGPGSRGEPRSATPTRAAPSPARP
ncbi:MAG: DMT family transporter [Planctomycetales bacterium]|nr:DMT family transporter [Planctomycetales bacterium]